MPLPFSNVPIPLQDPVAAPPREGVPNDKLAGFLTSPWVEWFNRLGGQVSSSPFVTNAVRISGGSGSISATDFSGGGLTAGLYRIAYYARITQAATTSSSLTITFSWTDGGVSLSLSGSAMTGNTVSTGQTGTLLVDIDAASPVRYATTYASVGATPMLYKLKITLENMQTA